MGPVGWFTLQAAAATAAGFAGLRLARCRPAVWKTAATLAAGVMLAWPLLRLRPAAALRWIDADVLIFIDMTGIVVPAALLLVVAALHVPRASERRAIFVLLGVCAVWFVHCGLWMVRPPLPRLPEARCVGDVCLQSTPYTCVAASLVTLLKAHGIEATETEMARLSFTEYRAGTTDTRAVRALRHKLAGRPLRVRFATMDYDALLSVPFPCVVSVRWGFFVSHTVPVLRADRDRVTLGDPLLGVRRVSVPEFLSLWNGRGIYLEAEPAPDRVTSGS